MLFPQLLLIFCYTIIINGVKFKIDGTIDLGNKWNYEYQIAEANTGKFSLALRTNNETNFYLGRLFTTVSLKQETIQVHKRNRTQKIHKSTINNGDKTGNKLRSRSSDYVQRNRGRNRENSEQKHSKKDNYMQAAPNESSAKINISLVIKSNTDIIKEKSPKDHHLNNRFPRHRAVFHKPHKVKDDENIQQYITYMINQAMKILDDMQEHHKDKINSHDFHKLKQSYKDKINEFIIKIEDHTVKTKFGTQKAILNAFDVSNIIIRKLLSHLDIGQIGGALRNHNTSNNFLRKKFEEELIFEYIHMCTEYDICVSRKSFSDFLVEFLKIILKTNNRKVKQASVALTEVLKDVDFAKIMDWESHKIFKVLIANMESMGEIGTRAILIILKSIIANRNQPFILYSTEDQALVKKTVAFQDILNDFDKALPGNKENTREWDHLTKSLSSWMIGENNDILNITKNLFKIIEKGIDKMPEEVAETVRKNIRLILQ